MEERKKIITPGNCDYFRKVVVPASLGDDTGDYAPKNGAYRNAIVEYEANGNAYIYSSDGIPTKINDYLPDEFVTTDKIVDGAITSRKIANGTITSTNISPSFLEYQAGDTETLEFNALGQTRNNTVKDIGYIIVQLPKPIAEGVTPTITSFAAAEIENIGFNSTTNVLNVLNSNSQVQTLDENHLNPVVANVLYGRKSFDFILKLRSGYTWNGFVNYNSVMIREMKINISFVESN